MLCSDNNECSNQFTQLILKRPKVTSKLNHLSKVLKFMDDILKMLQFYYVHIITSVRTNLPCTWSTNPTSSKVTGEVNPSYKN